MALHDRGTGSVCDSGQCVQTSEMDEASWSRAGLERLE